MRIRFFFEVTAAFQQELRRGVGAAPSRHGAPDLTVHRASARIRGVFSQVSSSRAGRRALPQASRWHLQLD